MLPRDAPMACSPTPSLILSLPSPTSSLLTNEMAPPGMTPRLRSLTEAEWPAGCSERPFSKAAASEEARRTLRYVESLSDARTQLAVFVNSLLAGLTSCQTIPTRPMRSVSAPLSINPGRWSVTIKGSMPISKGGGMPLSVGR